MAPDNKALQYVHTIANTTVVHVKLVIEWEHRNNDKGYLINHFTPTDLFSLIQNNEWKSPL